MLLFKFIVPFAYSISMQGSTDSNKLYRHIFVYTQTYDTIHTRTGRRGGPQPTHVHLRRSLQQYTERRDKNSKDYLFVCGQDGPARRVSAIYVNIFWCTYKYTDISRIHWYDFGSLIYPWHTYVFNKIQIVLDTFLPSSLHTGQSLGIHYYKDDYVSSELGPLRNDLPG